MKTSVCRVHCVHTFVLLKTYLSVSRSGRIKSERSHIPAKMAIITEEFLFFFFDWVLSSIYLFLTLPRMIIKTFTRQVN